MKLQKLESLVVQFAIASFVGWLYEILATCLIYGNYYDRGVLHLPMCPIYGFGAMILSVVLGRVKQVAHIFVLATVITAGFELLSAYVLEYGFQKVLWSYEGWPLNFQNRISLVSSMIFGGLAVLFLKGVKPWTERICRSGKPALLHALVIGVLLACIAWEGWICRMGAGIR